MYFLYLSKWHIWYEYIKVYTLRKATSPQGKRVDVVVSVRETFDVQIKVATHSVRKCTTVLFTLALLGLAG